MDPVARALLARYPLPTSAGTANNYRRVGNETVDQDQFDVRIDHRLPADRDQVFGRLTRFTRDVHAGDAAARRQRLDHRHARSAGHDAPGRSRRAISAPSRPRLLNELRIGDTRRTRRPHGGGLTGSASTALGLPGIPSTARFPNTLPTFSIARLSAARLAAEHRHRLRHQRHRDRRHADLAEGPAHVQGGRRPALGAAERASSRRRRPGRSRSATCSPICRASPTPARRSPAFCSARCSSSRSICSRTRSATARTSRSTSSQDDWRVSDRVTVNAGVRYTLNFPSTEENNQAAVFNLETQQLEYLGPRRSAARRAPAAQGQLRAAPRRRRRASPTRRSCAPATGWCGSRWPASRRRSRRRCSRSCRPSRSGRSTTSSPAFVLADGPSVEPIPLTPDAGLGQGVFAVDRDLGSGYVQQWNASVQRELTANISVEVGLRRVEDHARRHSRHEPQSAHRRSARARARRCCSACPIRTSASFRARRRSAIRRFRVAQLLKPFPQYTTVSLYRNNVGTTQLSRRSTRSSNSGSRAACRTW